MSSEKKWGLKKKLLLACGSIVFTLLLLEIAGTTYAYFFYPRLVVSDEIVGRQADLIGGVARVASGAPARRCEGLVGLFEDRVRRHGRVRGRGADRGVGRSDGIPVGGPHAEPVGGVGEQVGEHVRHPGGVDGRTVGR